MQPYHHLLLYDPQSLAIPLQFHQQYENRNRELAAQVLPRTKYNRNFLAAWKMIECSIILIQYTLFDQKIKVSNLLSPRPEFENWNVKKIILGLFPTRKFVGIHLGKLRIVCSFYEKVPIFFE